jgi:hypothetical protein
MMDLVMVALLVAGFGLATAFVSLCARLTQRGPLWKEDRL